MIKKFYAVLGAWVFGAVVLISACGEDESKTPIPTEPGPQTGALAAPQVTFPERDPFTSNSDTLRIRGFCPQGSNVELREDATDEEACDDGNFSFLIRRTVDGSYHFTLQSVTPEQESSLVSQEWIRDTEAPAPVTIKSPAKNPFRSTNLAIQLNGGCEPKALVRARRAESLSTRCDSHGRFKLNLDQSANGSGTYEYRLSQTDVAGNTSPIVVFVWVIESGTPPPPDAPSLREPVEVAPGDFGEFKSKEDLRILGGCVDKTKVLVSFSGRERSVDCRDGRFSLKVRTDCDSTLELAFRSRDRAGNKSDATRLKWRKNCAAGGD